MLLSAPSLIAASGKSVPRSRLCGRAAVIRGPKQFSPNVCPVEPTGGGQGCSLLLCVKTAKDWMQTFLVTGGCGFIGSHLCDALLREGHAVRVLDDLSSGSPENLPRGVEFVRGDVARPETARLALNGVQGCFHLAAIASVERGMQDWVGTHRVNLTGTIVLLEQIRRLPGRERIPFVYASSAAVYGDCDALPLTETSVPRPLSAYGADKLACELHARVASVAHDIPTVGLRFFNVFGPRQNPASPYSGVISIFCDRLGRGEAVEVFGDGHQTRDFIFVRDVVTALVHAMTICPSGAPVFNVWTGPVHLGNRDRGRNRCAVRHSATDPGASATLGRGQTFRRFAG